MSINPEALNPDSLTAREHALAQLRDPDLTPGEHRAAWFVYRRSSKCPLTSDAHAGVAFLDGSGE